jgi:hypothetical protein
MNKGTDRTANITGRKNKLNFSLDLYFNTNERPPWITSARKKLEPLNQATQEAKSEQRPHIELDLVQCERTY